MGMNNIFIILGYGVPKNILSDGNYGHYLPITFNTIYEASIRGAAKPVVVFSGGPTDIFKPYRRVEATEMARFFREQLKKLPPRQRNWRMYSEQKSLSTLENLLFAKDLLKKQRVTGSNITIFCEATREHRVSVLAKRLFGKHYSLHVVPIDFDTSSNRYLGADFFETKEARVLQLDLWALKSADNYKRYHQLFLEKISFLRSKGAKHHAKAIEEWWQMKLKAIDELDLKKN